MTMKTVQVLLSTFNGERFLKPLMDSLFEQDYTNMEILVRDDGSSDHTIQLLQEYEKRYPNIDVICGQNLGVIQSFFELLKLSSPAVDYFAFCDQDDIWEKNKISRAVSSLGSLSWSMPSLYCSDYLLVDEQMNIMKQIKKSRIRPSFENALVENIATGCTIAINKISRQLLLQEIPKMALMHDWWIYLVISAFGKVVYDSEHKILYRQHSSNVVGVKSRSIARWVARIQRLLRQGSLTPVTEQAIEFRRIYASSLTEDKKMILDRFIDGRKSFIDRLRYALSCETYRQSKVDNIILRLLIILGRI